MAQVSSLVPPPSTLTQLIAANPPNHHENLYQALALQVQYNLQYQHNWTSLCIHTHSPLTQRLLPRPLISGLPPHRIYVHPDEQTELLKKDATDKDLNVEREWVLPTHLREKWSLKRFAEIFDAIGVIPPSTTAVGKGAEEKGDDVEASAPADNKRKGCKRLLLSTLEDDSTVVYYIVHDGIVKPRQN